MHYWWHFLAGQAAAANHQLQCDHDPGHSSGNCALCEYAQQTALTTSAELPMIVVMPTGEITTPELPIPLQSLCHFSFGPRSPPCFASL